MNSKAIKRQLLAAIAMVLVAAIALGSSTYAWFVASGTVKAEGMSVTAQGESGLLISYKGGTWGSTATAANDTDPQAGKALFPASTATLTKWTHATAEKTSEAKASDSYADITSSVFDDAGFIKNNPYVVMEPFNIRSSSSSNKAYGLYVSDISVTVGGSDPSKTMSTALRVGVKYTDSTNPDNPQSKFFIYGPVSVPKGSTELKNKPLQSYSVTEVTGTGETATKTTKLVTLHEIGTANALIPVETPITSDSNGVEVQIFIWIEGEDHNLFTDNFNTEDLEVSVSFKCLNDPGATQTA